MLSARMAVWSPLFGEGMTRVFDERGIAAALLLSLAGIALRAYVPHHQMASEEKVKDGVLTPEEARRRNRFLELSAATVTLIGVAVLGWVLLEMVA